MKKTNQATEAQSNHSWIKKLKVAIAAFAFLAAGVFGASVADVPAPSEVDETAHASYAKPTYPKPWDDGRPFPNGWRTGTWS